MSKVNFIMISTTHKILMLLKITKSLKQFFRSIVDFHFLKNNYSFFSQHIMMENPWPEEENIIKDLRNLIRLGKLKKETIDTTIKDIKIFCKLQKK